jgi:hypothetical protein
MLKILRQKGNANQKYIEIPSYLSQNSNHQENKKQQIMVRIQEKSNLYTLLMVMETSEPQWKSVWRFIRKTKNRPTF